MVLYPSDLRNAETAICEALELLEAIGAKPEHLERAEQALREG